MGQLLITNFPYYTQFKLFLLDYEIKHNVKLKITDIGTDAIIDYVKRKYGVDITKIKVEDQL